MRTATTPFPRPVANQTSAAAATEDAYRRLAEGIAAVMELEGPDSHIAAVLREAVLEVCGAGPHLGTPAFTGLYVSHFGHWKASHLNE